jgi:hypothetical protein
LVGNNGQDLWEQAYLIQKGANYGWSVYEGSHPFRLSRTMGPSPLAPPAVEHPHSEARSLSGGVVYHGTRFPELQGAYIYGDWSTGKIWAVKHDGTRVVWHREIADTPLQLTGFGLDIKGDLVVIDHQTGFYRFVRTPTNRQATPFPSRLSETGLFRSVRDRLPDPALILYSVNSPLWSDGASRSGSWRSGNEKVILRLAARGGTSQGSVMVKTFLLDLEQDARRRPRSRP